jgi:hypothetical protein
MAKRPSPAQRPSLQEVLAFPFQGDDWQGKFGIGIGLLLLSFFIPFLPAVFVYGYVVEVMGVTIAAGRPALPVWQEWGRLFRDGGKALGVGLVYLLPGLAVLTFGCCFYFAATFGLALQDVNTAATPDDSFGFVILGAMAVLFLSMSVGSLLVILGAIPLPVAAGSLAATSEFGAAFRLGYLLRLMRANPMGFFAAWVVYAGINALAYALSLVLYYTLVLACLLPFLLLPIVYYAVLVGAAEFGLAYRQAQAKLTV